MNYQVKEIFYSLQGEGAHAGRPAVFCRFSGCNLWSGREKDRGQAKCWFCDTDFVGTDGDGGGSFSSAEDLASAIAAKWPSAEVPPYVIFTGGEPLLQVDETLIRECKKHNCICAVETNGTIAAPPGLDWITVSPKPNSELAQTRGDELKLVYPHEVKPTAVANLSFTHFFLSPLTASAAGVTEKNTQLALAFCKENPQWKLTGQFHKMWNIP